MLKIDNSLLEEVGLSTLPAAEKNSFLKHIYETLEMRVGIRLADQMSNQQLDEFEKYFEAKDDAGAFKWLETNFPNYKDIVQQEFDKLKSEVAQTAPQILAGSQSSAAAVPQDGQFAQTAPQPQPAAQTSQPQPQPYAPPAPPAPAPTRPDPVPPPVPAPSLPPTPGPQAPPSQPLPPTPPIPPATSGPVPPQPPSVPQPYSPVPQTPMPQASPQAAPPQPFQQPPAGPGL